MAESIHGLNCLALLCERRIRKGRGGVGRFALRLTGGGLRYLAGGRNSLRLLVAAVSSADSRRCHSAVVVRPFVGSRTPGMAESIHGLSLGDFGFSFRIAEQLIADRAGPIIDVSIRCACRRDGIGLGQCVPLGSQRHIRRDRCVKCIFIFAMQPVYKMISVFSRCSRLRDCRSIFRCNSLNGAAAGRIKRNPVFSLFRCVGRRVFGIGGSGGDIRCPSCEGISILCRCFFGCVGVSGRITLQDGGGVNHSAVIVFPGNRIAGCKLTEVIIPVILFL